MLKSILCDYSDVYILANGKINITGVGDDVTKMRQTFEKDKEVAMKK